MFWASLSFQSIVNTLQCNLEVLHDVLMVVLIMITTVVLFLMATAVNNVVVANVVLDSPVLEVTWTLLPVLILASIAAPSLWMLCIQDTFQVKPDLSVSLISSQWNWQSVVFDETEHTLDSEVMDNCVSLNSPLKIPVGEMFRFLLTSSDVLHSLGVPSLGVKLDANPGRVNVAATECDSLGVFWGSCFELCGSGHSMMPLIVFSS